MEIEASEKVQVDGATISYRRIGSGEPLLMLNGFAATSADWDPSFIDRLAASHELVIMDNRGVGGSSDDGEPFEISRLAEDAERVVEALGFASVSVLGWSMGGFIAQTFASHYPEATKKLVLLSTDPGSPDADRTSTAIWSQLIDMSGTPHEQARCLLALLFPADVAESFYRQFGDIIAAARAQLSPDVVKRQAAAMNGWHRMGLGSRVREIQVPVLVATGTEDIVIPPSNSLKLANTIRGAWLAQFPHGGHAFIAQYPRILAALINSFLEVEM
jgi:pimeloyl-ACP methyl ester carboxylesterase